MRMNRDGYLLWKDNEITQMFLDDIREAIEDLKNTKKVGNTLEQIGMNEIIRSAKIEVLEKFLTWEIEEQENDAS